MSKQTVLRHYDNMITWANNNKGNKRYCDILMWMNLKRVEVPSMSDCDLCNKYFLINGKCDGCPIALAGFPGCTNMEYKAIIAYGHSHDMEGFIKALEAERAFLDKILEPD